MSVTPIWSGKRRPNLQRANPSNSRRKWSCLPFNVPTAKLSCYPWQGFPLPCWFAPLTTPHSQSLPYNAGRRARDCLQVLVSPEEPPGKGARTRHSPYPPTGPFVSSNHIVLSDAQRFKSDLSCPTCVQRSRLFLVDVRKLWVGHYIMLFRCYITVSACHPVLPRCFRVFSEAPTGL